MLEELFNCSFDAKPDYEKIKMLFKQKIQTLLIPEQIYQQADDDIQSEYSTDETDEKIESVNLNKSVKKSNFTMFELARIKKSQLI